MIPIFLVFSKSHRADIALTPANDINLDVWGFGDFGVFALFFNFGVLDFSGISILGFEVFRILNLVVSFFMTYFVTYVLIVLMWPRTDGAWVENI